MESLGSAGPVHSLVVGGHCTVSLVCLGPVPNTSSLADMAQVTALRLSLMLQPNRQPLANC